MKPKALILTCVLLAVAAPVLAADISTHSFLNCHLPDTGQSDSYSTTFGEDHDYSPSAAQPGYTVYNPAGISSVTVDNRTGLMWVTNTADAGINGLYIWEDSIAGCEALVYGGYSDWRLPNIRELASIVNYGSYNPAINTSYFMNTPDEIFWSATTDAETVGAAWQVLFSEGNSNVTGKTDTARIRCVRGGP